MTESDNPDRCVEFLCREKYYDDLPKPVPANSYVPEWFKGLDNSFGDGNPTVTQCRPFLDALTIGWIVPLAADIQVKANERGEIEFGWDFEIPLMHRQKDGVMGQQSPYGNTSICQWLSPWRIRVPDGYSVLATAPMNRAEPRFSVFSGIIDADQGLFNLNSPFIWEQAPYDGVVEEGTPIIQIIPFNRDGILSDASVKRMDEEDEREARREDKQKLEHPSRYKDRKWVPKKGSRLFESED